MKNTPLVWILVSFILFISIPEVAISQRVIQISGTVMGENSDNQDIRVSILKDSIVRDTRKVLQSGAFFIDAPLDSGFILKFTKTNHITQMVKIEEDLRKEAKKDTQYILKDLQVKLFMYYDSVEITGFDKPVGKIYFSPDSDKYLFKIDNFVDLAFRKLKDKRDADELYIKTYKPIFEEKIGQATKEANLGNFETATSLLTEAKRLFPKSRVVPSKIKEFEKMKRAIAEKLRQDKTNMYRTILDKADAEFNVQNYDQARNLYVQAQSIKPEEQYPSYMMKRIDEFIGIKETKQMDVLKIAEYYERTIKQGDSLLHLKKYAQARQIYQKAIRLNRTETYAKGKIAYISSIIGEENKQLTDSLNSEKKYASTIALADNAYKASNFEDALSLYRNSLAFKPKAQYPLVQIKKIEDSQAQKISKEQKAKEIEDKYQQLIKDADFYMSYQKLTDATYSYNEALKVKPLDKYVESKLNEIQLMQQKQLEKEHSIARKEEEYNDKIKAADNYFQLAKYDQATRFYTEASRQKPIEPYPKSQMLKIAEIIKDIEAKKLVENSYKNSISLADKALEKKQFYDAKNLYNDALYHKPNDQYATEKILKINKLIADFEASAQESNEKQAAFSNALSKGEMHLKNGEFAEAKMAFEQAKDLGINSKFASYRILETEKLKEQSIKNKEEQRKIEEKYKLTILSGDEAFKAQNYKKAKEAYTRAMEMQATDSYPRDRIAEIENILNTKLQTELDQKAKEAAFASAASSGDSAFNMKKYFEAFVFYKRATSLKPSDAATIAKLSKTESIVEEEKKKELENRKKEKDFNDLIFQAENLILTQSFEEAIRLFEEAKKLNPNSNLPKDKIAEAKGLIEKKQKQHEDEIKDNLIMAEKAIVENDFRVARFYFGQVINLNPDNKEAVAKLKELDKLDEIKKKESKVKAYAEALAEANKAYQAKELNVAEYYFTKALEINPDDQSPNEMIAKINKDKEVLRQKTIDDTYTDYISSGNKAIESKDYGVAITYFSKAKNLKPLEPYPDQKIIDIKKLISNK